MSLVNAWIDAVVTTLWSTPTFFIIFTLGIAFTLGTKFIQFRAWTHGVALLRGKYDDRRDPGAINHFQALATALSGTVGLGNIGGVAIAIALGDPARLEDVLEAMGMAA